MNIYDSFSQPFVVVAVVILIHKIKKSCECNVKVLLNFRTLYVVHVYLPTSHSNEL